MSIAIASKKKSSKPVKSDSSAAVAALIEAKLEQFRKELLTPAPKSEAKQVEKKSPKTEAKAPARRAVVQRKEFTVESLDGIHKLTIPVVLIDDIAIYDRKHFRELNKKSRVHAIEQLDKKIAEFIGYETLVEVTTL